MTRKQPDGPRTSVAFLLAQVGARAAQEFAKALMPLKLAPADAGILRLLSHSPGISQQDLARKLDMHASRLVAVIDALEERALVVREANAQDRLIYSLQLTDAGEEMLRAIGEVARAHNEAIASGWILRSALHWLDCCNELRPATNSRRASIRATRICA